MTKRWDSFHSLVAVVCVGLGMLLGDFGPLFHTHDQRIERMQSERDSLIHAHQRARQAFLTSLHDEQARTAFYQARAGQVDTVVRVLSRRAVQLVHDTVRSADTVLSELRPVVIALTDSIEVMRTTHVLIEESMGRQIAILTQRVAVLETENSLLTERLGEALDGWKKASRRCRLLTVSAGYGVRGPDALIGASCAIL